MAERTPIAGLIAEFDQPEPLKDAARRLRAHDYAHLEAFTPMPVEGLGEILDNQDTLVPAFVLGGGLFGSTAAFCFMSWTWIWDYPINIGGRPMFSWPSYIPITFEMAVLFGAFSGGIAMMLLNRLPRLNHPVFEVPGFERASQDRFFLMVHADDREFERQKTRDVLLDLGPRAVSEVPR